MYMMCVSGYNIFSMSKYMRATIFINDIDKLVLVFKMNVLPQKMREKMYEKYVSCRKTQQYSAKTLLIKIVVRLSHDFKHQ